jgi:hypothetical protein
MRISQKAFLSCALVAAAGLMAAPEAAATGGCPTWTVTYQGPCAVSSSTPSACLPAGTDGPFTAVRYSISGSHISNVATLVTVNNLGNISVVPSTGVSIAKPCFGDSSTNLGKNSCHEIAVRINPNASTWSFWVVVPGRKQSVPTSIAVKTGACTKAYLVPGLGFDTNAFALAQKKETINFKGCAYDFAYDSLTNDVVSTDFNEDQSTKPLCGLSDPPGSCCSQLISTTIDKLKLMLDADVCEVPPCDLGLPKFGDGYVSSGEDSCTTRVIGGKLYSWGSPCPP